MHNKFYGIFSAAQRAHTHTHTHLNCVKFITITAERQWSTIEPELQTPTHRRGCLTLNVEYEPLLLSTPPPPPFDCYLCALLVLAGLPQCFGFGGHFIAAWPDTCLSRYGGFNARLFVRMYIYNLIVFHRPCRGPLSL